MIQEFFRMLVLFFLIKSYSNYIEFPKYHYSIRTNEKLKNPYSLEKLSSRLNFGFMIKNLYVSEDKSLYHLLLFKYKEKTEVILRHKFLIDFNQNMQDYVIEVTENKALISVLFKMIMKVCTGYLVI